MKYSNKHSQSNERDKQITDLAVKTQKREELSLPGDFVQGFPEILMFDLRVENKNAYVNLRETEKDDS